MFFHTFCLPRFAFFLSVPLHPSCDKPPSLFGQCMTLPATSTFAPSVFACALAFRCLPRAALQRRPKKPPAHACHRRTFVSIDDVGPFCTSRPLFFLLNEASPFRSPPTNILKFKPPSYPVWVLAPLSAIASSFSIRLLHFFHALNDFCI